MDIEEIRLTEDEVVDALFSSKGELFQLISSGLLKKSISRFNGKTEIDAESSFFDGLEFAMFLYLDNFFSREVAIKLSEEWADDIGNDMLNS